MLTMASKLLKLLIILVCSGAVIADEESTQFDPRGEDWFENDSWLDDDAEERSIEVNEGELTFIEPLTERKVLHNDIELTINDQSLSTGWVQMRQCYYHINPVENTDIVYQYEQIKNLRITSQDNIGKLTLDEQVVNMKDVNPNASLCVAADVRLLDKAATTTNGKTVFKMSSGPYHLRFFDGFYPYHLTITVFYPSDNLQYLAIKPRLQALFQLSHASDHLSLDTWFEGMLNIQISFVESTKLVF